MGNAPSVSVMVPLMEKLIVSPETEAAMALRSEPAPPSLRLLTVFVAAAAICTHTAAANAISRQLAGRTVFCIFMLSPALWIIASRASQPIKSTVQCRAVRDGKLAGDNRRRARHLRPNT